MLKEMIKENILKKENTNYYSKTYGTVVRLNNNNTCSVSIQDQHGPGKILLEDVPIHVNSVGTHTTQLRVGDLVDVDFARRSILTPKVTGVHFMDYSDIASQETHLSQSLVFSTEETFINKNVSMLELYTKGNNKNSTEYYKNVDPIHDVYDMCSKIGTYCDKEIGITSRYTQSTVKITQDGSILISISNECNLSINANDKTVTINSCGYNINCNGKVNIRCNDEINVKTNKNITLDCDNLILVANEFIHHDKDADKDV